MQKTNEALKKMADGMTSFDSKMQIFNDGMILLESKLQKFAESMASLELKMEKTTGKLNARIDTVDGIIRKPN